MNLNRREFLKKGSCGLVGLVSLGGTSFLLNRCSKNEDNSPYHGNLFENYDFQVDYPPYRELNYSLSDSSSSVTGQMFFEPAPFDIFHVVNSNDQFISGISGKRSLNKLNDESLIYTFDSEKRYLPKGLYFDHKKKNSQPFVHLTELINALTQGNGVFVDKLDEYLPSWDWEAVYERPGMLYLGDWTFEELKNFTGLAAETSSLVFMLFGNPGFAQAYATLSQAGEYFNLLEGGIDAINHFFPGAIDKNKRFSHYSPGLYQNAFLIAGHEIAGLIQNRQEDIKNFIPLNPGSYWNYKINGALHSAWILGTKEVKEKELIQFVDEGGIKNYLGFDGNSLKYYGFHDSSVGNVFINPPLTMGDDFIQVGKRYFTMSNLVFESNPELSGTIQELFEYQDRERIVAWNKPYGGCFKVLDSADLVLKVNGEEITNSSKITNWYSRNVGRVKSDYNGQISELFSYGLFGDEKKFSIEKNVNSFSLVPSLVLETLKNR